MREGSADIWFLSAYEFFTHWRIEEPRFVVIVDELNDEAKDDLYQATLTLSGVKKVKSDPDAPDADLIPAVDYEVKREGTALWRPFTETDDTKGCRHQYIMKRNPRPRCVKFSRCPLPTMRGEKDRVEERNARILLAYFRPFTLRREEATEHVLHPETVFLSKQSWHSV